MDCSHKFHPCPVKLKRMRLGWRKDHVSSVGRWDVASLYVKNYCSPNCRCLRGFWRGYKEGEADLAESQKSHRSLVSGTGWCTFLLCFFFEVRGWRFDLRWHHIFAFSVWQFPLVVFFFFFCRHLERCNGCSVVFSFPNRWHFHSGHFNVGFLMRASNPPGVWVSHFRFRLIC